MEAPLKDINEELYDRYSASYNEIAAKHMRFSGEGPEYFMAQRGIRIEERLRAWNIRPNSFLDYGGGIGNAIPMLKKHYPEARIVTTDISSKSVEVARERYGDIARCIALRDFVPSGDLDAACSFGVFHHIPPESRNTAMQTVRDSLKPGGVFIVSEHNPWNPGTRLITSMAEDDRHAVLLSAGRAKRLFRKHGFEILSTDYLFIFPRFLKWLRPLERYAMPFPIGAQHMIISRKTA